MERFLRGEIPLGRDKKVYLIRDDQGIARQIKKALGKKSIKAHCLTMDTLLHQEDISDMAGLVLIPEKIESTDLKATGFLKKALLLARKCGPTLCREAIEKGAFFATLSFMDGALGFGSTPLNNPLSGGLAGLLKTADLEWEKVNCTALDLPCDPDFVLSRGRSHGSTHDKPKPP